MQGVLDVTRGATSEDWYDIRNCVNTFALGWNHPDGGGVLLWAVRIASRGGRPRYM